MEMLFRQVTMSLNNTSLDLLPDLFSSRRLQVEVEIDTLFRKWKILKHLFPCEWIHVDTKQLTLLIKNIETILNDYKDTIDHGLKDCCSPSVIDQICIHFRGIINIKLSIMNEILLAISHPWDDKMYFECLSYVKEIMDETQIILP